MDSEKNDINFDMKSERIKLMDRLFSKKDAIIQASQELEDIRSQYQTAGDSDPDGRFETEAWKHMYVIVSGLSELNAYAKHPIDLYALNGVLRRFVKFHALTKSDAISRDTLILLNSIAIRWDLKRGPVVQFGKLNLFNLQPKSF